MHQTKAIKKTGSFTIKLPPLKNTCFLPIEVQVKQAAIASAHRNDKRKTRNKAKAWKKEAV